MQLAQVNVARLRHPLDAPETAEFTAALAPVNALAEAAPGFVWRLATPAGDATAIRIDEDELVIVNLSVWESVEALRAFVYDTAHRTYLRRRSEWFVRWSGPHTALWWVPEGARPTPDAAMRRLALLAERGPTPEAFGLARPLPAPAG